MQYDPNGYDRHEPGAKLDGGKLRLDLFHSGFAKAIRAVAQVTTYGANKYTENGWKQVPNPIDRYIAACYRHLSDWENGEYLDNESGLPHLSHAAWNILAVLQFCEENREGDLHKLFRDILKEETECSSPLTQKPQEQTLGEDVVPFTLQPVPSMESQEVGDTMSVEIGSYIPMIDIIRK